MHFARNSHYLIFISYTLPREYIVFLSGERMVGKTISQRRTAELKSSEYSHGQLEQEPAPKIAPLENAEEARHSLPIESELRNDEELPEDGVNSTTRGHPESSLIPKTLGQRSFSLKIPSLSISEFS